MKSGVSSMAPSAGSSTLSRKTHLTGESHRIGPSTLVARVATMYAVVLPCFKGHSCGTSEMDLTDRMNIGDTDRSPIAMTDVGGEMRYHF